MDGSPPVYGVIETTTVAPPAKGYLDFLSVLVGIFIGMLLMLLLVWIAYLARVFAFAYCADGPRLCKGSEYYNDPGDALANGAQLSDILFLNDENELLYKRLPKISNCTPGEDQLVTIMYPQYCSFTINGTTITGEAIAYNSPIYQAGSNTVTTSGNCTPVSGASAGVPELRWNPNPLF